MATLPSQHPHLAVHLTDRALTPVVSSSFSPQQLLLQQQQQQQTGPSSSSSQKRTPKQPTFSTSPPPSSPESSATSSSLSDDGHDADTSSSPAASLSLLTSTALASYDTAKRLDRGAPLRTMIEYGRGCDRDRDRDNRNTKDKGGPVVLHSYMCPMGLALGIPGRRGSHGSLATAAGGALDPSEDGGGGGGGIGLEEPGELQQSDVPEGRKSGKPLAAAALYPPLPIHARREEGEAAAAAAADGDGEGPNAPPMLISTVVAPGAEHLRDARRAAGRLERLARGLQAEWASGGGTT